MSVASSAAAERVLAALRGLGLTPRRSGSGWSCRCPAHEDRNPSLSIGIGGDQRALLTCHAGCATEAVVAALGLKMRDLMPDTERRRGERPKASKARAVPVGHASGTPHDRADALEDAPRSSRESCPSAASPDALIVSFRGSHGTPAGRWTYHDASGNEVGIVVRWNTTSTNGKPAKIVRPFSLIDGAWVNKAMPAPRPLWHLPELLALPSGAWIYVCEGEKAAEAARAIGVVATTSAGGSKAAAHTDWSPVREKVVVVLPDNDEPGEAYADEVVELCQKAGAEMVCVLRLWEHWPAQPLAGDIVDVLELEGGDAESVHERIDELAAATEPEPSGSEHQPSVQRYRPFPIGALPEPVRSYVGEGAAAIGCDASFVALPMLSGLAGAIGNSRRIQLKRGWAEPAILWTAIVGESGTQKSPAFRLGLKAVRTRQHRAMKEHQQAIKKWEADSQFFEIDLAQWKKQAAKCSTPPEPPAAPEKPICPRVWIEDSTTEALATLLLENPRGLLTLRNELSGWFSFGQYKNGGGADDVARWLQMFDADPLIVDRKTSGTTYVPCAAVSIAGGIQPAILHRSVGEQHRDNGLLARLLLAHPPRRAKRWTEAELDPMTEGAVMTLFDRLYALEAEQDADGDPTPRLLRMDAAAKAAWIDFVNEHGQEQLALVGDEAAAWSKLEGYAARIALVVHLVRAAAEDPTLTDADTVDAASIASGVRLSRWFATEARRVYATLAADDEEREVQNLIELLERHGEPVSPREWQKVRSLKRKEQAEAELDALAVAGFGTWHDALPGPKGGRPTRRFALAGVLRGSDETSPTTTKPRGQETASGVP